MRTRARTRWGAGAVVALVVGLLVAGCSVPDAGDGQATEGRDWYWDPEAGADDAAGFMEVAVPKGATGVKGAVQVNPQENQYILTFVTSEKAAEEVAASLHSEEPLTVRKNEIKPWSVLLERLRLAKPYALKGARWAGVCPPCVSDPRRKKVQWIEIYVRGLKGDRARVYLSAF
ncbi:hypothetical protein ACFYO9_05270 [Streptomyces sp. NPDC005863]|uniref:hypothetical protein n=1 Tax=unclassified Streptomyces TaxID=2593676 RepID=UPI0033EFE22E